MTHEPLLALKTSLATAREGVGHHVAARQARCAEQFTLLWD
ncbi:hypothetical protein [Brucella pseudogrignonensis]|uniref:Uncharacterized protein n=1 Tax=Brucella pseudogrignonensis TaxID=419475 RepID=A0A256G8R3_9HYPH|nr:hypothetical protein [Brucella pseudogrignonensis]OYR23515.1 hypothetical protein CEV34_3519 [Brucella pseudogrignonensis]